MKRDWKLLIKKQLTILDNTPAKIIVSSFLIIILLGSVLLSLPISSKGSTSFLTSLFTATSATCVTGLTLTDTAQSWSVFGQIIILMLIQIGGLGLITISIFFYVISGKKLGLRGRQLAQETINVTESEGLADLIKFTIKMTLIIELLGAIMLSAIYIKKVGLLKGIYISIFMSISAFCNAGFDIVGNELPLGKLISYQDNLIILTIISNLIVFGGLGYIVWYDIYKKIKSHGHKILLHTKVVLMMSVILILGIFIIFLMLERDNPLTLGGLKIRDKINISIFQSINLRTAGFSVIKFKNLKQITKVMCLITMLIGGAPGSTSGGLKVTTLAILLMTVIGVIKNQDETTILRYRVNKNVVYRSFSMLFLSIIVIFVGSILIYTSGLPREGVSFSNSLTGVISAFSTVGFPTETLENINLFGKLVMMMMMFIGRVGPISFLLSLASKTQGPSNAVLPEGKIMVT